MTRIERRLLVRSSLLGFLLTLLVLIADWRGKDGLFARMENNLYDLRARRFQFFTPPPTDKLVHIDIDDPSLQYMGQWPWPRALLAELTDVMRESGAKAVAFDVLFSEREPTTLRRKLVREKVETPDQASKTVKVEWRERETIEELDGDAAFAAAIRRFGAVILPASYEPRPGSSRDGVAMYKALYDDLLRSPKEVLDVMAKEGFHIGDLGQFDSLFSRARKEALFDRITRLLDTNSPTDGQAGNHLTYDEVVRRLFPGAELRVQREFPFGLLREQYNRAVAFRSLRRFARPLPPGLPPVLPAIAELAPVNELAASAGGSCYVNFISDLDGVVRSTELWRECDGRLIPQFGLMLACAYLGVDIGRVEIKSDHILLPKPDGTMLRIPVFAQRVNIVDETCSMNFAVPWFGPSDRRDAWERMYDYDRYVDKAQHLPMLKLWELIEFRRRIRQNNASMKEAMGSIYEVTEGADKFEKISLREDDVDAHVRLMDEIYKRGDHETATGGALGKSPKEVDELLADVPKAEAEKIRRTLAAVTELPRLREQTLDMQRSLGHAQTALRNQLDGKAIIVGFTATGRTDVVPTSLVAQVPGPVVHGVVFSAIMTGEVWTVASPWVTRLLTIIVGLLATAAVAYFHPLNAMLMSLAIAAGYLALNFLYLFDYSNVIVGAAAPLVSVGLVWSGCTLMRFIVERADRRRIEGRFRGYVDSALVDAIVENPEKVHFEGESREMTVVFTDLEGFTTISETLKARTVPILNEYMRRMVKIIRSEEKPRHRRGYRNKFLGDGIMFFFGAPWENSSHAIDAVETVLNMQQEMPNFNEWLKEQHLPPVRMRAGISTGEMIVGDAGTQGAADYTVLGDDVNFGARIESANKAVGTLVMISQRTKELCDAVFLCRPIARLQVVGKTTGIKVYEPLCYREQATEVQKTLAKASETMVDLFTRGDFAGCIGHVKTMDELFGSSKLTALYRRECERYIAEPPGEAFDGTIVLAEK